MLTKEIAIELLTMRWIAWCCFASSPPIHSIAVDYGRRVPKDVGHPKGDGFGVPASRRGSSAGAKTKTKNPAHGTGGRGSGTQRLNANKIEVRWVGPAGTTQSNRSGSWHRCDPPPFGQP